jgi:hypothetical protein
MQKEKNAVISVIKQNYMYMPKSPETKTEFHFIFQLALYLQSPNHIVIFS